MVTTQALDMLARLSLGVDIPSLMQANKVAMRRDFHGRGVLGPNKRFTVHLVVGARQKRFERTFAQKRKSKRLLMFRENPVLRMRQCNNSTAPRKLRV